MQGALIFESETCGRTNKNRLRLRFDSKNDDDDDDNNDAAADAANDDDDADDAVTDLTSSAKSVLYLCFLSNFVS